MLSVCGGLRPGGRHGLQSGDQEDGKHCPLK